jgi:hypothetical protein
LKGTGGAHPYCDLFEKRNNIVFVQERQWKERAQEKKRKEDERKQKEVLQ